MITVTPRAMPMISGDTRAVPSTVDEALDEVRLRAASREPDEDRRTAGTTPSSRGTTSSGSGSAGCRDPPTDDPDDHHDEREEEETENELLAARHRSRRPSASDVAEKCASIVRPIGGDE
jgi:hypothetical protein